MTSVKMSLPVLADVRIGVIGLGYVGLPLAVYLARHFPVLGFDIDKERVASSAKASTHLEVTEEVCVPELEKASGLSFNRDF